MWGPAVFCLTQNDHETAQKFFYQGLLTAVFAFMAGLALTQISSRASPGRRLIELIAVFVLLPAVAAVPVYSILPSAGLFDSYFEMVSCFTTTGLTILQSFYPNGAGIVIAGQDGSFAGDFETLSASLNLWRAEVSWLGGLLIWLTAVEILAPLQVGGFELTGSANRWSLTERVTISGSKLRPGVRRWFVIAIYAGMTAVLCLLLIGAGSSPIDALIAAMSTLSTSGISAESGYATAASSVVGEAFVLVALLAALSGMLVGSLRWGFKPRDLGFDSEFGLAFLLILTSVVLLLLFHRYEVAAIRSWAQFWELGRSMWGTAFTTVSFLTTTGFKSIYWSAAIEWQPPGFLKLSTLGAAIIGGGVATTAGGIKLLRVVEIIRLVSSEIGRVTFPSLISQQTLSAGSGKGNAALLAGVFVMLFVLLLALVSLGLTLMGFGFEEATVLATAALTTTGPLVPAVLGENINLLDQSVPTKLLLCTAMVIGRLELLALISVFNPDLWKRQ